MIEKLKKKFPKLALLWSNMWSPNSFAVMTFCAALFGSQSMWFTKRYNNVVGNLLYTFKSWVDESFILNLVVFIFVASVTICYFCKEIKKRRFDGIGLTLSTLFLFYVSMNSFWVYSNTIFPFISYFWVCIFVLAAIIISKLWSFINLIVDCFKEPQNEEGLTGYIVRDPNERVDTGWEPVAQTIAGKLLKSDVRNNNVAIGIAGAWGSGKTTFLEIVESKTKDNFNVIRFNPWNTDGAKQLSSDFFNTLSANLNLSREAIKTINKYSDILSDFNDSPVIAHLLEKVLPEEDNSLSSLKETIQNAISNNPKPVLVIIDDVDRLEKDEIFEVLKLIRVTADFKNMVYIAAYDKNYVEQQIGGRVANPDVFLRKIFTIEVVLPSYEPVLVPRQLCRDIKKVITDQNIRKSLFELIAKKEDGKFICTNYLKNFRDELSFINQFATSIQSIGSADATNEISIEDLFILELIRFGNSGAYELLKIDPTSLLKIDRQSDGILVYKIDDDKYKQHYYKDQEGEGFKKQTLYLLFGFIFNTQHMVNGLRFLNNYDKYFSLRLPEYIMSANEFSNLTSKAEDEPIVLDVSHQKKLDSILWHIGTYPIKTGENLKAYNIIRLMLCLLETKVGSQIPSLMRSFTMKFLFTETDFYHKVRGMLEGIISSKPDIQFLVNKIICELHSIEAFDPEEDNSSIEKQDIISDTVLEYLASQSLSKYVERSGTLPAVSDILRPKGAFKEFLTSLVADIAYDRTNPQERHKKPLALAKLKELYGPKDSHEINEFWKAITPTDDDVKHGYEDLLWEEGKDSIFTVFGERCYYIDFVNACFTISNEDHQKFLDNMGICL